MLKSTAGGGGIGMRLCRVGAASSREAFESVQRLGRANFGDGGVFLERFVARARHVEVQIFGDGQGDVVALGERDCSVQRRNQKVIEETPAPGLAHATRERSATPRVRLGRAVSYRSAGTVEFVYDDDTRRVLLPRGQHPPAGRARRDRRGHRHRSGRVDGASRPPAITLPPSAPQPPRGARHRGAPLRRGPGEELPAQRRPLTAGRVSRRTPASKPGSRPAPRSRRYYDPLLAKIIVRGADARRGRRRAARRPRPTRGIAGIETNLAYLRQVVRAPPAFARRRRLHRLLARTFRSPQRSRCSTPARRPPCRTAPAASATGTSACRRRARWTTWPSAWPIASSATRRAPPGSRSPLTGPTLRFTLRHGHRAHRRADDGRRRRRCRYPIWQPVAVAAGPTLSSAPSPARAAAPISPSRGGFDVPAVSRQPRHLHARRLRRSRRARAAGGDVLRHRAAEREPAGRADAAGAARVTRRLGDRRRSRPARRARFLHRRATSTTFFAADLEGPLPLRPHRRPPDRPEARWARPTAARPACTPPTSTTTPTPSAPSTSPATCRSSSAPTAPASAASSARPRSSRAERWKIGQLQGRRPRPLPSRVTDERRPRRPRTRQLDRCPPGYAVQQAVAALRPRRRPSADSADPRRGRPGCRTRRPHRESSTGATATGTCWSNTARNVLDLALRFRVHALMQALERRGLPGIIDLTPGVRSLHIHYDPAALPTREPCSRAARVDRARPAATSTTSWSRRASSTCRSPGTTRPPDWPSASTCSRCGPTRPGARATSSSSAASTASSPSTTCAASSSTPATWCSAWATSTSARPWPRPLDPRHRLVTTKYNPARTWTPENAVGIGGAYLCVYGMEGPGGYQFVGRTVQMWNTLPLHRTSRRHAVAAALLRPDPLLPGRGAEELLRLREAFPYGKTHVRIEESSFRYSTYKTWLDENPSSIAAFKAGQQAAFEAERERWRAAGQDVVASAPPPPTRGRPRRPGGLLGRHEPHRRQRLEARHRHGGPHPGGRPGGHRRGDEDRDRRRRDVRRRRAEPPRFARGGGHARAGPGVRARRGLTGGERRREGPRGVTRLGDLS